MFRRWLIVILVFGLLALIWWLWPARPHRDGSASGRAGVPARAEAPVPATVVPVSISSLTANVEPRSTLADKLNAPEGTIQMDLAILQEILVAWRSNLPHAGNPVGENAEITAVLAGENSLQLALLPKDHPAINRAGELCDRWGTPFRFHQISGAQMEMVSAGPDRTFGTVDDARF